MTTEAQDPRPAPPPVEEGPLEKFARELVEKRAQRVLKENSETWEPRATWATDLGYECERRIVYHRVRPHDAAKIDETLASIFREGKIHEKDVRQQLDDLGAELVEGQRGFLDERLDVSGAIDGKLLVPWPGLKKPRRVTLEIKGVTGAPPKSQEQWAKTESPLMRRYYAQNQIYMYAHSEDVALALFKSKTTGEWAILPLKLDYEYGEKLLQRAERVRDSVIAWKAAPDDARREAALLPRLHDRSECARCPWKDTACHPGDAPIDPALIAEDAVLAEQLERREKIDGPRKEYEKLQKHLRARFELTKGDTFIVGAKFKVTKKPHGKTWMLKVERLELVGAEPVDESTDD